MTIKLTKTAVNSKTRLLAEDCVPWTQAVLLLVSVFESAFKFLLWLVLLNDSKSVQRKNITTGYHRSP